MYNVPIQIPDVLKSSTYMNLIYFPNDIETMCWLCDPFCMSHDLGTMAWSCDLFVCHITWEQWTARNGLQLQKKNLQKLDTYYLLWMCNNKSILNRWDLPSLKNDTTWTGHMIFLYVSWPGNNPKRPWNNGLVMWPLLYAKWPWNSGLVMWPFCMSHDLRTMAF